jgi:hypothetical protein
MRNFGLRRRLRVGVALALLSATELLAPSTALATSYSYWWTQSYTVDNAYVHAYATWTFYKIDGSSTNVFVMVQGSAYGKPPYDLFRFEPWLMRKSGGTATLGNWAPTQWTPANDGQQITFSFTYGGASFSTTFTANASGYQPYASSNMFSVEWQGARRDGHTIANNAAERWYNFSTSYLYLGICGKSYYYAIHVWYTWGACGNRTR